jgi:hypothetical protein
VKQPTLSDRIEVMLQHIHSAEAEAVGCDDCFQLLDRCAESVQSGRPLEEMYPQIKKHLEDCHCCSAEFKALLTALSAASQTAG